MIVQTLEATLTSSAKRKTYVKVIGIALAALILIKMVWISDLAHGSGLRQLVDFDVFYIVAQLVWHGDIERAYRFVTMVEAQRAASGTDAFMPWTYPPQFDLLIAPLAYLPRGLAYGLFMVGTLMIYLAVLRNIAREYFPLTVIVLFPAFVITIACGQNGFLTGALIGLVCIGVQGGRFSAGLPLGLMVIKPHLAIAFAVYTLVSRRWGVVLMAAAIVVVTSAFATLLLGTSIWSAVLAGVYEARVFLENGMYPLFRMVSVYAALYTLGLPTQIAMIAQVIVAVFSLAIICHAVYRGVPLRQVLGLTAIGSLLISPYAYDYDMPIYGIGLALLLPDLLRFASTNERGALYGLSLFTTFFGLIQSFRLQAEFGSNAASVVIDEHSTPVSLAGITLIFILALVWNVLRRSRVLGASMADASPASNLSSQRA